MMFQVARWNAWPRLQGQKKLIFVSSITKDGQDLTLHSRCSYRRHVTEVLHQQAVVGGVAFNAKQ